MLQHQPLMDGIDDVISDSDSFVNLGTDEKVTTSNLQAFSRNIYNILLTLGIAVAVISGIIIGIKYMLGSVEERADYKKTMIPYLIGAFMVFTVSLIPQIIFKFMENF